MSNNRFGWILSGDSERELLTVFWITRLVREARLWYQSDESWIRPKFVE
jgi:hypothetical protein